MSDQVLWSVGKEGTAQTRLDLPPFRAFFYWLRDGQLVNAGDFNAQELEAELLRRKTVGEDTVPFEQALKALKQ